MVSILRFRLSEIEHNHTLNVKNYMNQLTKSESKYLRMFDRRDIRIRIARTVKNQSKWPLIENWTVYYSEPWTINQMLERKFNYGIRCGRPIGNYFNVVIDLDDLWAKERIKVSRYVETGKGIHRYVLIKELPKSCWLVDERGDKIGEIHSRGRQVVGIGSIHENGKRYGLKGRVNIKFSLHFETLRELQAFLKERDILTTPWGNKGLEKVRDLELYQVKPKPKFFPPKRASFVETKAKIKL